MKKRLGAIPKGLEWISEQSQQVEKRMPAYKLNDQDSQVVSAAKRGLAQDLTRATFIMQQEYLEKIKAYAYWERVQIKDVLDEMCAQFFEDKKVRSIPERKK